MTLTASPFDDIRHLLTSMPPAHAESVANVRTRNRVLTKHEGSLGRLETLVEWLAAWQGKAPPTIAKPALAVYVANHGLGARLHPETPPGQTRSLVELVAAGGAAVNAAALGAGAGLQVLDLALDLPTPDITAAAALAERDCAATMAYGMEVLAREPDLLCLSDMSLGSEAIAAALSYALFGGDPEDWAGGDELTANAVRDASAFHGDALSDPLQALRRVGGRDIAATAGAILAARHARVPVVLDGYAVTAGAAVLFKLDPGAIDHCVAAHVSAHPGHKRLLESLGLLPLLDFGVVQSQGTGAALAVPILRSACEIHQGMATQEQSKVPLKPASA